MEIHHSLKINTKVELEAFRTSWLQTLSESRWADIEEVKVILVNENAMLIPLYAIQYRPCHDDKGAGYQTITARSEFNPPSEESITQRLQQVGLSYEELVQMAKGGSESDKCAFHDKYWRGSISSGGPDSDIPELIKLMIDEKAKELLILPKKSGEKSSSDQQHEESNDWTKADVAFTISVRIDRLFTNKDAILSLNVSCYDGNDLSNDPWIISEPDNNSWFQECLSVLAVHSRILVYRLFGSSSGATHPALTDRKALDYKEGSQDVKANEWLELDHATLSDNGVRWEPIPTDHSTTGEEQEPAK